MVILLKAQQHVEDFLTNDFTQEAWILYLSSSHSSAVIYAKQQ